MSTSFRRAIPEICCLLFTLAAMTTAQTPDYMIVNTRSGASVLYDISSITGLTFSGIQGSDTLNVNLATGAVLQYSIPRLQSITFSIFEPNDSLLIEIKDGPARWYSLSSDLELSFIDWGVTALVDHPRPGIISTYRLEQNYPNPFNPSTTIQYSLPRQAEVRLTVSTVLGQVVDVLVDEPQCAGMHGVVWDASAHPSGLYFYRLQAGAYRETKTMLLLK